MANGVELATAYVTIIPSLKGATKQIESQLAGVDTSKAGSAIGKSLGGSIGRSLDLSAIGDGLSSAGSKLADVGGKLTAGITVPLAGATAAVGTFALRTASAAETTEISFTTMLGSEEAALSMMEELADFAAHTPFELSGLQTATRQLLAYGFTAEDVIPMLTAVGDATAALGTGQAGIESVTRALGQMQTRGKVSAEEMLQLTEAGIPAWEYLARAIGTDTAGAMEAVSDGAVDAQTGIDALTRGMEEDFGGMMEEQSKTVEGLFSNLSDAIEQPLMELRETDAYEDFAESLEDVVDAAGPFVESLLPHMERGLETAADVLDAATDAMGAFADMGEDGQEQLIGMATDAALAGPALTVAGKGMQVLGSATKGAGSLIKTGSKLVGGFGDKLLDFATAPETAGTALGKFAGVVSAIPGPAKLAGVAIGGVLVSGIVDYYNWSTKADREAQVQAEALRVLASASETAGAAMEGASEGPRALGTEIYNLGEDIQENWQSIADLGGAFAEIDAAASAQIGQLSSARQAIADYNGQTDLSTQQLGSFRAAIETVNAQCGTNYEVVKDAGGAYYVMQDGAQVAADEIYGLIDAQIEQARVSAQLDKLESLYAEQAEQAQEYAAALQQVSDAQEAYDAALEKYGEQGSNWALDDLEEAKANLAEVETQLNSTGDAIAGVEAGIGNMTAASQGAVKGFDALVMGSAGLNTLFAQTGLDMQEFSDDLAASGVSLDTFAALTDAELMQIAAGWDGTTGSIIAALDEMEIEIPASGWTSMLGLSTALSEGGATAINTALSVSGMTAQQFSDKVGEYGITGEASIVAFANAIAAGDSPDVAAQKARDTVGALSGVPGEMGAIGADGSESFASGVGSAEGETGAAAGRLASAAGGMADVGDTWTWGYHSGSNFASGLRGAVDIVAGAAASIAAKAAAYLKHSTPDVGPLSDDDVWGLHLGQNFADGMARAIPDVERAALAMAEAASVDAGATFAAESRAHRAMPAAARAGSGGDTYRVYLDGSLVAVDSRIAQALAALLGAVERRYDMGGAVA